MIRLTTPTVYMTLPDDVPYESIAWLRWTFAQGGRNVFIKTAEEIVVNGQELSVAFSQADTKLFEASSPIRTQLRIGLLDGTALASEEYIIDVSDVLDDEVIEG